MSRPGYVPKTQHVQTSNCFKIIGALPPPLANCAPPPLTSLDSRMIIIVDLYQILSTKKNIKNFFLTYRA